MFSVQVFGYFSVILLLLISKFESTVIKEHTLCDFSYFKFVKICFTTQDMVNHGYILWALEMNVYSAVVAQSVLYVSTLVDDVIEVFFSLLIFCLVLLAVERCMEVSSCNYKLVYFFFQFYQFCFTYFATLLFCAYTFRIALSSW